MSNDSQSSDQLVPEGLEPGDLEMLSRIEGEIRDALAPANPALPMGNQTGTADPSDGWRPCPSCGVLPPQMHLADCTGRQIPVRMDVTAQMIAATPPDLFIAACLAVPISPRLTLTVESDLLLYGYWLTLSAWRPIGGLLPGLFMEVEQISVERIVQTRMARIGGERRAVYEVGKMVRALGEAMVRDD